MTAKTKHGHKAHPPAHGADPGTPHERLNRAHAQPGRPEGAMMGAPPPPETAAPQPPMTGAAPPMAPPGAGPQPDDEEGEQT